MFKGNVKVSEAEFSAMITWRCNQKYIIYLKLHFHNLLDLYMIHSSVVISNAVIHEKNIGPFYIGDGVKIGEKIIYSHVSIVGDTIIENSNTFYPFCSIGSEPQDLK